MLAATPFNRFSVRRHRDRAAAGFADVSFLKAAMAQIIAERLADVNRRFERALDLGCHSGWPEARVAGSVVSCDLSAAMLGKASGPKLVCDEEALPFAPASFDLAVSAGSLHWVNDLPGCLVQLRAILKPDGFFIATLVGGDSLHELRGCLLQAEADILEGARPRVSPMVDVRDAGALLQRAGFAMPVAEVDRVTASYADPLMLLHELRAMGESSALSDTAPLRRDVLLRACALYRAGHSDADGRVRATFAFITMAGWAPAPDQPKPLRPGSAKARLADALGTRETSLRDR
jgi:NADH dehydrogenase [ubiquinone] 1 alpha subcomplex assembly factor 5